MATGIRTDQGTNLFGSMAHTSPQHQAYRLLQVVFVLAPVVAGVDKFFDYLTNWDMYLAPVVSKALDTHEHQFMMFVGIVEIAAGILVAIKPRYFAYVVAAWLAGIIINLLLAAAFYDIALRDFGLMLSALALARLAQVFDPPSGMRST